MIDPAPNVKKQAAEPPAPLPSRPYGEWESTAGAPAMTVSGQRESATRSSPVHAVRLDGATMRLYAETRDPETERVLFHLPTAHEGESKDRPAGASLEA